MALNFTSSEYGAEIFGDIFENYNLRITGKSRCRATLTAEPRMAAWPFERSFQNPERRDEGRGDRRVVVGGSTVDCGHYHYWLEFQTWQFVGMSG